MSSITVSSSIIGNALVEDKLKAKELRHVEQGEPLRKIAAEYTVSYETIRRVVRAARKLQAGLGKGWEAALKNEYTK